MPKKQVKRIAKTGEIYAYYIDCLGKYGACQIIAVQEKSICLLTLDYLELTPPGEDMLEDLKPYHRESYRYHHQMAKSWFDKSPVPRDYLLIGECGLKTDPVCNSYSGRKWPMGEDYCYEERWKALDEKARAAYKKYINSGEFVTVHGQMFKKNLGGLRDELYQCLTEEDSLEDFPCIRYAEVKGYSRKLVKYCSTAPMLRTLRLENSGVEILDFRDTHLEHLELDMSDIRELILPKTIRSLHMYGNITSDLQINDTFCAGKIDLHLSLKKAIPIRYGLKNLQVCRLHLKEMNELDMMQIVENFSEIEHLGIWGLPGSVVHMDAVRQLRALRSLYCQDLFGFVASEMEALQELPELREIDFDSIPKEAGAYLKKVWKGRLDILSVTHLREEGWLRENLENPLRHWDGNEFIPQAAYRSARKCYKDTKKQLLEATGREQIEEIVRGYTRHFNKLNEKYEEFIETEEREDIFQAMQNLYEECILHGVCRETDEKKAPITLEEVWDVMESVREDW